MKCYHKTVAALAAICSVVIFATLASAQAPKAKTSQEILDAASSKMSAYKTWTADYTQTMKMFGTDMAVNGQVIQKPPHRVWMQLDMPIMGQHSQMTMVMGQDGIMWQVMQMGGQQHIMKMDMNKVGSNSLARAGMRGNPLDQFDPQKQLEQTKEMFDFGVIPGKDIDGQPMYALDGAWKAGALTNQQMAMAAALVSKTRVFIGQNDGFVHRLEQYDKSKTNLVMTMEFRNLKFNQDVPDATFVYAPPAGAPITDLTSMIENQMGGTTGGGAPPPAAPAPAPTPAPASPPAPKSPAPSSK